MELFTFIGILCCPIFTLGLVLIHYDKPLLGVMALIISIFFSDD